MNLRRAPDAIEGAQRKLSPKVDLITRWHLQVSRDGRVNSGGRRLATVLTQHLWEDREQPGRFYTKRSQGDFADDLEVSRKLVQEGFKSLVQRGHLEAVVQKGRGQENRYTLALQLTGGTAPVAVIAAAPLPEVKIEALTAVYAEEIEHLRQHPEDAHRFRAGDLFAEVQSAFPAEKRAPLGSEAETDFLEVVGWGWAPVDLFHDAGRVIRNAQEKGHEIPSVARWIREHRAHERFE